MPAAAARLRTIQRAVPRSSASWPNTDVHTRRSTRAPVTAPVSLTLTRSLKTVAAGLTASLISLRDWNVMEELQW